MFRTGKEAIFMKFKETVELAGTHLWLAKWRFTFYTPPFFCSGTVPKFDHNTRMHGIKYDDDDDYESWIMKNETWRPYKSIKSTHDEALEYSRTSISCYFKP